MEARAQKRVGKLVVARSRENDGERIDPLSEGFDLVGLAHPTRRAKRCDGFTRRVDHVGRSVHDDREARWSPRGTAALGSRGIHGVSLGRRGRLAMVALSGNARGAGARVEQSCARPAATP